MKIQCDMCEKKEASVYCTADEASLCDGCDRRVHHANKLANKHLRFSLQSSSDDPPRCDTCQERKAILFCKEDRAILCRVCDVSIHSANEHTQNHTRFLLAGVKLSDSSSCYKSSSDQALYCSNSDGSSESDCRKSCVVSEDQNIRAGNKSTSVNDHWDGVNQEEGVSMEASSISEYLIETLPGWHVDEFLDPSASHPYSFYEAYDNSTLPFMAYEADGNRDVGSLWSEDLGILVNSCIDHNNISRTSLSKGHFNEVNSRKKIKDQQTPWQNHL